VFYDGSLDLAGGDAGGLEYEVSIQVALHGVQSQTDFSVVIYNPCVDPAYLSVIAGQDYVPDFHYYLGMEDNTWSNKAFDIVATDKVKALCGALTYSATFADETAQ
jgi:hypothetical protein